MAMSRSIGVFLHPAVDVFLNVRVRTVDTSTFAAREPFLVTCRWSIVSALGLLARYNAIAVLRADLHDRALDCLGGAE